jgi:hypothetical protein
MSLTGDVAERIDILVIPHMEDALRRINLTGTGLFF